MTHILFISPYYTPEKGAAAVCVSETATQLVQRGYQVTVLTTVPNYPTGIVPPEYRGRAMQHEVIDGVQVVRVWSYTCPNKGFLRRILAHFSFAILAPLLGWKAVGYPDLIIAQSPPLFDAIAVRILAWQKRCPFIFMVSDLWPEAAIKLGMLRNRVLIWLSERLEWSTYQRASLVWVVTEGIRNTLLQRGLSAERLFLLTNGVNTSKFYPLLKAQARVELGWDDRYTILYAGNHGLIYALNTVLDAAKQLKAYTGMHFVLVGNGVKKAELIAQSRAHDLKNVTFVDAMPHDRMPLLVAGADVCLIPLRNLSLTEDYLPVKMFEIMACGRPFILSAEGESRLLVEQEARAGICVEPENTDALVSAILYLHEHPVEAELLGQRGREFVKARFDSAQLTAALDARMTQLLAKEIPPSISVSTTKVKTLSD